MLKVKWYGNTTSQFDPLQVSCPFLNQIDFVIDGTRWLKEFIRTRGLAQKSQLSLPSSLGVLRYISRKNFKKVKKMHMSAALSAEYSEQTSSPCFRTY